MSLTLLDAARDHQRRRAAVADGAAAKAVRLFRRMPPTDLEYGWFRQAPAIEAVVVAAQLKAARQATPYTNTVAALSRVDTEPGRLVPQRFAGFTREGREVAPELFAAVTFTKSLIGSGFGVGRAFQSGAALMTILAANVVQDAGRMADDTIAVSKGFTYSVRVISPGACSRCAILAGVKGYRTNFERHPRCKCTSMPLMDADAAPKGFHRSTDEYFDSLSKAEQDRVFTKSGAESIRLGADPMKVVNARRGDSRTRTGLRTTTEGTTRRGIYGKRSGSPRLMPEQILKDAPSPEAARELLAKYGYIN